MYQSVLIALLRSAALLLLFAFAAEARTISGVRFPEAVQAGSSEMRLQGAGLLRYKVIFRGYVAALYQQAPRPDADTPAARRLEIEYFWDIPAGEFQKATVEGMRKNSDPENFAKLRNAVASKMSRGQIAAGQWHALRWPQDSAF